MPNDANHHRPIATKVWRADREEVDHLPTSHFLAQDRLLSGIHAMQLKDMLLRIHAITNNLVHGRPLRLRSKQLILAHSMPFRGRPLQHQGGHRCLLRLRTRTIVCSAFTVYAPHRRHHCKLEWITERRISTLGRSATKAGSRDMQTADSFLLEREFLMRNENLQNETSVARDPARGDAGQL